MAKTQSLFSKSVARDQISLISTMGTDVAADDSRYHPAWSSAKAGKSWAWHQVVRQDCFSMMACEGYQAEATAAIYTRWERYIKVNFLLCGRQTTILNGVEEYVHDQPELFIVSGPPGMLKIDVDQGGTRNASVALCLLPEFFAQHLGLDPGELPQPLRFAANGAPKLYRLPLSSANAVATRSILCAPANLRRKPAYALAKTVELMCLVIEEMQTRHASARHATGVRECHKARLYEARELLSRRYEEDLTLEQVAREVALNRTALSAGFRRLFGMSVHDWLYKVRMEHAHALLHEGARSIAQVADAVGYSQHSTFSTAFRSYFGCSPHNVRPNFSRHFTQRS